MAKRFRDTRMDPDRRAADSQNRAQRRAAEAEARRAEKQAKQRWTPAMADGRPLFHLVPPAGATCFYCERAGLIVKHWKLGEVMMNDPANPPPGCPQGDVHFTCRNHLPKNAVIYDPVSNRLQDKAGNDLGPGD